jgi:two-component system LytT family sensor kinase
MALAARAATSRAFPPVHRLTTRAQWLVFVAVVLAFVWFATPPTADDLQGRGFDVHWWHVLTNGLIGLAFVVAMARPVWRVLDAVPLAPGHRWRNGAARLGLGAAYAALDATWAYAATIVTVWLYGLDARMLAERDAAWTYHFVQGLAGFAILLIAHTILQRSHQIRQREALERSLALARLQALSLELQPHFLFNTLNGIAALMRDDPRRAERMLVRLGDLLRITLRAGADGEIPLRRELEHLDLYLDLQNMRFGTRLTVVRDVDPATLGARVPSMLLQPLVENALTHGISPRAGPGRLEVTARREGQMLVLRVRDDGVGPAPGVDHGERTGIGATRARLAALFDGAQTFSLSPADGGGTVAEVRIPFTSDFAD